MPKYRLVSVRAESPTEKALREWFEAQRLASPDHLDEAAKLIIGLVTGFLTVLFGVLTVAAKDLPQYLSILLCAGWVYWRWSSCWSA